MKKFTLLLICLLLLVAVAGCGTGQKKIVGFWEIDEEFNVYDYNNSQYASSYEFFSDGTCMLDGNIGGEYTIEKDRLMITTDSAWYTDASYSIDLSRSKMDLTETNEQKTVTYNKD